MLAVPSLATAMTPLRAAASARPAKAAGASYELTFGPIKDDGYKAEGIVSTESGTAGTLAFTITKVSKSQTQGYVWSYDKAVTLKAASNLKSAKIKVKLGKLGSVSFAYKAVGGLHVVKQSTGNEQCIDPRHNETKGIATGAFKFNTKTKPFGKITGKNVKATLTKEPVGTCPPNIKLYTETLSGSKKLTGNTLAASLVGDEHSVTVQYDSLKPAAKGFLFGATILQTAPGTIFKPATNLKSSKIKVSGPFMSGSVKFKDTMLCGTGFAYGSLTGTVKAKFLIGGTQKYPSKAAAKPTLKPPAGTPNPFGTLTLNNATPACT